ncbi:MAG: hypothetical protein ABI780_12905 [Ardenticatenales bacterium]
MTLNVEAEADVRVAAVGPLRVARRALGVLLQRWPTVIAVLVVLHAYLAVFGICAVSSAPWCPPVLDRGDWFGTSGYYISNMLATILSASAWALGAAVLLPRLAASWPDRKGADGAPPRFSPVALGRCLAVGLVFAAVASLASVPLWYLSFRDGGFDPSSRYWNDLSFVESVYGFASSVALAPVKYLMIVAIVHDGLPIVPAFAQARDAITGWTSTVAAPLWLLQLLQPGTLWSIAFLTLPSSLIVPIVEFPPAIGLLRFADAVVVVFTLALALGLWRDVCGATSEATA